MQRQTAVTAYFSSKLLLLFALAGQHKLTDPGIEGKGDKNLFDKLKTVFSSKKKRYIMAEGLNS